MASIIVFPTTATHRRLPHLPKDKKDKRAFAEESHPSSASEQYKDHKDHLGIHANGTLDAASLPANAQQLAIAATPQTLLLKEHLRQSPDARNNLTINTQPRDSQAITANAAIDRTLSGTPGSSSLSSVTPEHASRSVAGQDDYSRGNNQHPLQLHPPLNSPRSSVSLTSTPQSALPPSGAIASLSSSTSSLQESKTLKHALYDAFGCLYHPVQHTHHPTSALNGSSSSSSSHSVRLSGTTAAALRSGEVTPLMGMSPRVSPLLRPHTGASAPITPLELSSEDVRVHGGYFGVQGTSSTASGNTHRPRHAQHHVPHHHTHHPSRRASSHLSTSSSSKYADEGHQRLTNHSSDGGSGTGGSNDSHNNLLNNKVGASAGPSRRSSTDFSLSPTEHPVLCSLHTLSLTHPHPPCHYHPHLGHDLGHDRVSLTLEQTMSDRNGNHAAQTTSMQQSQTFPAAQSPLPLSDETPTLLTTVNVPAAPLTPSELLLIPPDPALTKVTHPGASPFPMDQQGDGSLHGMGHQGLV